jgi:hypothetical protein
MLSTCCKCLQRKGLSEFGVDARRPGGRKSRCRKCEREHRKPSDPAATKARSAAYRAKNRERLAQKQRDKAFARPEIALIASAKRRAKERGLLFDLVAADVFIPEFCPALGLRLKRGRGKPCDASPSLDRVDPARGYVRGNVIVVSHKANRIKQDATAAELYRVARFYSHYARAKS